MIIETEYQNALEDFRKNGEMELAAILKLFENCGNKHSDSCGDGILDRTNMGSAWVFTDWVISINRYPKYGEKIVATTWSERPNTPFTCARDFELFCNGEKVISAITRWALIDLKTGRPQKITEELISKYQPETKSNFPDFKFPKVEMPEQWQLEKEIVQRRGDIDFNDHVHNITYLDYAMETLPQDLYNNRGFKNIHIAYKLPLMEGEKTVCKYANVDGRCVFGVYGKDDVLKTQIEFC